MSISGTDLHAHVERIAAMGNRRCGSDIERRAMEHVRDTFADIGLRDVAIELFDIHHWNPVRCETELLPEKRNLRSKPIWYTGSTAADGLRGACVYCGYGLPHQFGEARDKIAVIDSRILLHFWPTYRFFNSYKAALDAGALALVVIIDAPGDLIPIFTADEAIRDNPIPAVLVTRSDGALLKERIAHATTEVRLTVEAETTVSQTGDVVGVLPGTSDEYLIVGAHHDSIYGGAVDNAGGMAALCAIAEELASRPEPPKKNIIFATHPGHELLIGTREFIKRRKHLLPKTAAYITLDGLGSDHYEEVDGRIVKSGREESRGIFLSPNPLLAEMAFPIVKKYRLQPAAFIPADVMCPNEDLEGRFFEAGVPIVDIIGKPVWYHTEQDTPDKCAPDQLERGTRAHLELIENLDDCPAAKLRAADRDLRDPGTLIKPATYREKPTIDFTHLPEQPKAGEASLIYVCEFDDREGIMVDMKWDIDGDTGFKGPLLIHVFDSPGEHRIALTVISDTGAEGMCEKTIAVT